MKEFLEVNGAEVANMLFTEWDMDKALAISKEEGYEDGVKYGVEYGEKIGLGSREYELIKVK